MPLSSGQSRRLPNPMTGQGAGSVRFHFPEGAAGARECRALFLTPRHRGRGRRTHTRSSGLQGSRALGRRPGFGAGENVEELPCDNAGECVFLPREVQTVGRKCVGGTRLRPLGQARGAQVRLGSGKRAAVGQRGFHLGHGPSIAIIHAFIPGPFVGCVLCARRWLGNETTDVNNTRSPPCGRWLLAGQTQGRGDVQ